MAQRLIRTEQELAERIANSISHVESDSTLRFWTPGTEPIDISSLPIGSILVNEEGGLLQRKKNNGEMESFLSRDRIEALISQNLAGLQSQLDAIPPDPVGKGFPVWDLTLGNDLIANYESWWHLRGDLWTGGKIGKPTPESLANFVDDRLEKLYLKWGGTQAGWNEGIGIEFPDFRGRKIVCAGQGDGLRDCPIGDLRGEEEHWQTGSEVGPHHHEVASYTYNTGNTTYDHTPKMRYSGGNHGQHFTHANARNSGFNVIDPDIALPYLIPLGVKVS